MLSYGPLPSADLRYTFYPFLLNLGMPCVSINSGRFHLEAIGLENAVILSIYEEPRLGSLILSTPIDGRVKSDMIIPPKIGAGAATLISEFTSSRSKKLVLLSFSCKIEPSKEELDSILSSVKTMLDRLHS